MTANCIGSLKYPIIAVFSSYVRCDMFTKKSSNMKTKMTEGRLHEFETISLQYGLKLNEIVAFNP